MKQKGKYGITKWHYWFIFIEYESLNGWIALVFVKQSIALALVFPDILIRELKVEIPDWW